jgi:hypothetical protein
VTSVGGSEAAARVPPVTFDDADQGTSAGVGLLKAALQDEPAPRRKAEVT